MDNKEIEYERFILNLDKRLISRINDHVFYLAAQGVKKYDEKNDREVKINKSSWAREVFEKSLNEEESSKQLPKNIELLKYLEEKYGADVIGKSLTNLDNILNLQR